MTEVDDVFCATLPPSHISSLRECSRRLLNGTLIQYDVPENYVDKFHELLLTLSDLNPALALTSEGNATSGIDRIIISVDGSHAIQLGGVEPDEFTICWVKAKLDDIWLNFRTNCIDLAHAGYPGCEGCVDDNPGGHWSEMLSRTSMKNQTKS